MKPRNLYSFTGPSLVPHAGIVSEVIKANGCNAVLDVGIGGIRPVKMVMGEFPIPAGGWWGVNADHYNPNAFDEVTESYDLVVVTAWLGTLALVDIKTAIDKMMVRASKAVIVIESQRDARPAPEGVLQRPDGWDRVEWLTALSRANGKAVLLIMSLQRPDGGRGFAYMSTAGDGNWERGARFAG